MSRINKPSKTLVVNVHIDTVVVNDVKTLIWSYNCMQPKPNCGPLRLRVPNDYGRLEFHLDKASAAEFRFATPDVENHDGYDDLVLLIDSVRDASIAIINNQTHSPPEPVGAITLKVEPLHTPGVGEPQYDPYSLISSDPEVVNTPNNNG